MEQQRHSEANKVSMIPKRRNVLGLFGVFFAAVAGSVLDTSPAMANSENSNTATTFEVIETGNAAQPCVLGAFTKQGEEKLLDSLSSCNVVFLGEHHDRAQDHVLQARILEGISDRKGKGNVCVGLEMVQVQYQSALDEYINNQEVSEEAAEKKLFENTKWEERWNWPFDRYLPVFRAARKRGIALVAVNVNSEALAKVRLGGLQGLDASERDLYVSDKKGFIEFGKTAGFRKYVDDVVLPSYDFHARMGLLGTDPSPARFYASRILWDEAMANLALKFLEDKSPATTMVMMEGADHVKYRRGTVGRIERLAKFLNKPNFKARSVLLNPSATDTLQDGDAPISLALKYDGGAMPVADYVWFSSSPSNTLVPPSLQIKKDKV